MASKHIAMGHGRGRDPKDQGKVLLTELNHTHGTSKPSTSGTKKGVNEANRFFAKDAHNLRVLQVSKTEDETLKWQGDDKPLPLPNGVKMNEVVSGMAKSIQFGSDKQRETWKKRFSSGRFLAINQDLFWWVFCDRFAKVGAGNITGQGIPKSLDRHELQQVIGRIKSKLFDRIATNYTEIVFKRPSRLKEVLLTNYWDTLAQFVFFSYIMAYPKSKHYFTIQMKHSLVDMLAEWVVGIRPTSVSFSHWSPLLDRKKTVKLVAKLIDDNKEKQLQQQKHQNELASHEAVRQQLIQNQNSMLMQGKKGRDDNGNKMQRTIHTSTPLRDSGYHPQYTQRVLRHSLLVQHFLKLHNASGSERNVTMCFTEDPSRPLRVLGDDPIRSHKKVYRRTIEDIKVRGPDEEDDEVEIPGVPKDINTYADVVQYAESKRKQMLKSYKDEVAKAREEVKNIRKRTQRECEHLKAQRQVALKGDVPEYSNFLVSSRAIEND